MIFKRKIYDELLTWKNEDAGKTAMLIKGARRVGKSTIAEEFAKNEYQSYILIDFVECPDEVKELFNDISNLNYIFMRLQMIYGIELVERKSVIIFDEVQFCPKARQAIKFLVKDHRYDYIETGSLITIRKNVEGILIPSEEVDICMYPMDFEEFRWAMGDMVSVKMLRECFKTKHSLGDTANRNIMRDFRLYMLVGGMPQAVETYITTNNMEKVDRTKRAIITLYENDFNRIDPSGNASALFHNIPASLTGNANRYMAWSATGTRNADLSEIISEMKESMVVNLSFHANDPNVGLALHQSTDRYKMYVGDTGLFITLAFWDKKFTDNVIYNKLLSNKLSADMGYVYENMVAQMLKTSGHELHYYTFPTESGKHNYEVDFLIADGHKISPIEVKSSGYKAHASLDAFQEKYSDRICHRYLIYTKDLRKDADIICIPIYMTMFL